MPENSIKYYVKELLNIAGPIIMGNLGFILIGLGDVIIAGRHSTDTFSAISLANAIVSVIMTFAMGLTSSISPLLSNYRGQNCEIKKYFYPSIRFSIILALLTCSLTIMVIPLIPKIGFEVRLIKPIQEYMFISALSTFGACLHGCLKEFLQAFEIVMFPNLVTIFCVFLNLVLNIIFVFGWGIIPSMGAIGLAISSLIVRYFMGLTLLIYCFMKMKFRNYEEKGYYKNLIKIGLPVSLAIMIEFVAFNGVSVLMGRVAGIYAAAQNLLTTLTTMSFMIPFAISNAIAVKVGFCNGAKDFERLKKFALIGTGMSVSFMIFSAIIYLSFPKFIVDIFTSDNNLYVIVLSVMVILGIFQVFDGLQISLSGICKGLKKTNIVLQANFVAYWCVSLPLGYYLAFVKDMKLVGFWVGLFFSSICLCGIMLFNLKKEFKNLM